MKKDVTELPDEILWKICDGAADRLFAHLKETQRVFPLRYESHIEMALSLALSSHWGNFVDGVVFQTAGTIEEFLTSARDSFDRDHEFASAMVATQVSVGKYRVDFLFGARQVLSDKLALYAVECDGHEFHEKTKEQAARDKSRDRELLKAGITTIRFAGSEVWADPMKCADAISSIIRNDAERAGIEAMKRVAA